MEKNKNLIQSVLKAIQIVEALDKNGEMGVRELSNNLGIGKSTVHRLVTTLKEKEWIIESKNNRKCMLSYKVFSLGKNAAESFSDKEMIHKEIELLAQSTRENVKVGVLYGDRVILIDQVESEFPIKVDPRKVGAPSPAYNSSLGKVLLAYKPEEYVIDRYKDYIFHKTAKNTITNLSDLLADLEKIREQGYACEYEECVDGMICFAVPIRNQFGDIPYGISISFLKYRYEDNMEEIEKIRETLIKMGQRLSRRLGYQQ